MAGLASFGRLTAAGWRLEEREQAYLPGPGVARPWTYGYRLVAG